MARPEDSAARNATRNGASYDPDFTELQGTPRTEQRRAPEPQRRPPEPPLTPRQHAAPPRTAGPGIAPQFDPYAPQAAPRQAAPQQQSPQARPLAPQDQRRAPMPDPRQQTARPTVDPRQQTQGYGLDQAGAPPRTVRQAGVASAPMQPTPGFVPPTAGRPGQTQRPAAPGYPAQPAPQSTNAGRGEPYFEPVPATGRRAPQTRQPAPVQDGRVRDGLGDDRFAPGVGRAATDLDDGTLDDRDDAYEDDEYQDEDTDGAEEPPRRRSYGVLMGVMLVAAILVGGGVGVAYNKFYLGHKTATGTPPMVEADQAPAKVVPASTPDAGSDASAKMDDRADANGAAAMTPAAPATVVKSQEPVAVAGAQGQSADPLAGPRKVATVVVKPGEKIDAAPPADGPVDAIPGLSIAGVDAGAANAAPVPANAANQPVKLGKTAKKMVVADATPPDPSAEDTTPAAPAQKVANANAAPKATGNGFVIQVVSANSQEDALAFFADMQQKYGTILGSMQPDIQQADLGTKGTKFRLRIGPPGSSVAAHELCTKLKAAGLKDCITAAY